MITSLSTLLNHGIFDSYEILTKDTNLDMPISGVSILETPDFEKYILDSTLILTTFYIIKNDTKLFLRLLKTLSEHNSPGIVIKLHRFIDEIPQRIINEANKCGITIVVLNYDANLSLIYKAIYAEMQSMDYLQRNFHSILSKIMTEIEKNPSTKVFIDHDKSEDGMSLLFYNYENEKIRKTDDLMLELFDRYKDSEDKYIKINNDILYKEIVEYNGTPAYMYMIYTSDEKRYLLDMYSEIYHILVMFIAQKKREMILQQDRFLTSFILNLTSLKTNQMDIVEEGKIYNWDINFPIFMILVTIDTDYFEKSLANISFALRDSIIRYGNCTNNEVKFIYVDNNKVLFIANARRKNTSDCAKALMNTLCDILPDKRYIISYTSKIAKAEEIPSRYRSMIDVSNYLFASKATSQIISPALLELMRLTKEMNSKDINELLFETIQPLLTYEKEHGMPLCDTLLTYYMQHFNMKSTAEKLFIHYNTLKYRLSIIEELYGDDIFSTDYDYITIMFALYMHSIGII